jgi:hypothetical protein
MRTRDIVAKAYFDGARSVWVPRPSLAELVWLRSQDPFVEVFSRFSGVSVTLEWCEFW